MQLLDLVKNKQFLYIFNKMYFKNTLGIKSMQYAEVRKHEIFMWENMFSVNRDEDTKLYMHIEKFIKEFGIILT